jgi:hypothetical protein
MRGPFPRFLASAGLSAVSGGLALLSLFWKDWIEALTRWDPDHHDGSLEWAIVVALVVVAVVFAQRSRSEWRALRQRRTVTVS